MLPATYFKNHIYIFGGYNGQNYLNNADEFDLVNKRWMNLASLPNIGYDNHILPFRTYFL